MEIGVEVPPSPKPRFLRRVSPLIGKVDFISIPDSPFGKPAPSSLALAVLLRNIGMEAVPNYRLMDRNELALLSEMMGLVELGMERVLLVGGDPPSVGRPTGLDAVRAIRLVREWGVRVKLGVATSLRPGERLRAKLEAGADFVVTQPIQRVEDLHPVADFVGNTPLYTMLMLTLAEMDESVLKAMDIEEVLEVDYRELMDRLRESGLVRGVIISSPRDHSRILEILGG